MARRNTRVGATVPMANEIGTDSINDIPTPMAQDDIRMIKEENEKSNEEKKLALLDKVVISGLVPLRTQK